MRIFIRTNASRSRGKDWGDVQYAEGLARAIQKHSGDLCELLYRGEAPYVIDNNSVLLQICGPHLEEPVPDIPNLLWMISPPTIMPLGMMARYQARFIGSQQLTITLRNRGLQAEYLPQATDSDHFNPALWPRKKKPYPIVFVGGYGPRVDRGIIFAAVEAGLEPQIWGPGWQGAIPERLWRGERLDYSELATVYANSEIVLNSHMASMAGLGFMSNRSYDALASGAMVISDRVIGFDDPSLPDLRQIDHFDDLPKAVDELLTQSAGLGDVRRARHENLVALHGFDQRARLIIASARALLERRQVPPRAFVKERLDPLPNISPIAAQSEHVVDVMRQASLEILLTARYLEKGQKPPEAGAVSALIHPLTADQHQMRDIAFKGLNAKTLPQIEPLVARSRRVYEALMDPIYPLARRVHSSELDQALAHIAGNQPLWAHAPEGFRRNSGKAALCLRSRSKLTKTDRPVGVFLHLYYAELAPLFGQWLKNIAVPVTLYVSTDTEEKAERILAALPHAQVRIFENRGRDIWPKLYGFSAAYKDHDIVLHLHGKKSPHGEGLDGWLQHILTSLLGSIGEVNRILSLFDTIPKLGMVVPVTFRNVLSAAHWGANRDIAREVARRMGMDKDLPDHDSLRFPVGSMFWARSTVVGPLLDLNLPQSAFPSEAGQLDGTLAHAIERMLGVTCRAKGAYILPVMAANSNLHRKHQIPFSSNRELREALERGEFNI